MKIRLLILAAVVFAAAVEAEQVWVSPGPGVDVTELSRDLIRDGHKIVTLAPEGRLLVEIGPRGIDEERQGIASVEPYSVVIEKDQPEGRGFGVRISTEKDKRFRKVEKIKPNALSRERARIERLGKRPRSQRRSGHWVADTGAGDPVVVRALDVGGEAEIVNATEGLDPSRPSYADNSISQYFPPIRSQGTGNSCTAWAVGYYYSTYTQAKDEDVIASGGDNDNICSPAFVFNLNNSGINWAIGFSEAFGLMENSGVSSWSLMPYVNGQWATWPSEAAWVDAMKRRINSYGGVQLYGSSPGEATPEILKQHIANGNVAVTSLYVYGNLYSDYPNETTGVQNGVLFAKAGSPVASHAVTIVGYDDNRPYFDGTETKYGAWLLANSWGPNWGVPNTAGGSGCGFFWLAYDYAMTSDGLSSVMWASDKTQYRPELYMLVGIDHQQGGFVNYRTYTDEYLYGWTSSNILPYTWEVAWANPDIILTHDERIACDMTDAIEYIAFPDVELGCRIEIGCGVCDPGTLANAEVFHDLDGDGIFASVESTDPPLTLNSCQVKYATISFSYP